MLNYVDLDLFTYLQMLYQICLEINDIWKN